MVDTALTDGKIMYKAGVPMVDRGGAVPTAASSKSGASTANLSLCASFHETRYCDFSREADQTPTATQHKEACKYLYLIACSIHQGRHL